MNQRDYYEVLGVDRNADLRTLKKAYHRLAMEFHPDRNPDPSAEARFKEASEAYQVLSDPEKRRIYDTRGFAGLKNNGFSGFSGVGMDEIFSNFGDLFSDFFGFGTRTRRGSDHQRGSDVRVELVIDFHEALFGVARDITFDQYVPCRRCDGTGAEPGSQPQRCPACQGRGQVVHGQGMFLISTTCPQCHGRGSRPGEICRDCDGRARERAERTVQIKIPAGFEDGASLRYSGEGEPGIGGGPPGDLYVHVRVKPHPTLRREGYDLITEAHVDMLDAALGTQIEIEGPEGPERVSIPKGTQPNDVITLRKKGVPRLRGSGRGDLHVVCRVKVPKSLSSKEKKLLEELRSLRK